MLRILGQRPDGYHLLQTVFQFIDAGDLLSFKIRQDGQISRSSEPQAIPAATDLTVRAAQLLQKQTSCPLGVEIRLEKFLPLGSGLGGGSSDAATTLVALNQLWKLGLDKATLLHLGLQLGADIPVFINGTAAWGEGIGEQLTPITLAEPWYLILVPDCHVSTKIIFSELTRHSSPITIANFLADDEGSQDNDCLTVVKSQYPQVAAALKWIERLGTEGRLTGTGACVFVAMPSKYAAQEALGKIPKDFSGFIASGQNQSPLGKYI
jgi:4-diphosphocytidyl-2-C-methyl-D-erythritol kinase